MMLFIRMMLYAASAGLAGYGIGTYDAAAETFTIDLSQLSEIIGGVATFLATFASSRVAKANGGHT